MPRRVLLALIASVAALAVGPGPASALDTHVCASSSAFRCGTVTVPLDRSGRVPGTVKLSVAVEAPRQGASGFLLALSGGPGQPSIPFAESFRASLAPALAHRRLVVFDQRGTGASGALSCPPLQALGTLDVVNTRIVERCANALGPRRQFYTTTDSVLDIDAVRAAIGAPKLELMGVSYGTYVAAQYARRFPATTDGLILDSVVGPDGIDAYFLDTFQRLPRVLTEQCAAGRCRAATDDPVADLGRLTRALAKAPLRGEVPDALGVPHATAVHDESELLLMIMSGDLNPFLQAALPGAIAAATRGDAAPLLRLRRYAQGPPTPVSELSSTLNVATTCADVKLPYTLLTPYPDRWTLWRHGVDGVPDSAFAPFSRAAVTDTSVAHDCLRWPWGDTPAGPSTDPLPDVPTLLLSGRLDTRTPLENSNEMVPLLPHAQLLTVAGTGHDVLDSDITGCAARALRRFADDRAIGTPCSGKDNAVPVLARPSRSLSAYRRPPGVPGNRGRTLFAALDTIVDAQVSALQTLYAGFTHVQGGGLRGGRFSASANGERLRLHDYELVPGLTVTGALRASDTADAGTVTVDGPGELDGRLRITAKGVVTGRLGGRAVRYDPAKDTGSSAAIRAGRSPEALRLPSLAAAMQRARRVALPALAVRG
ncbi:MAG TPA: alpha/beta fold hydrolase [Baekduia sp.]|uniref:alpha/beta fold hydrolase n=1 Tax=Baekduia sp. TaxID=2600305 RepID=UPI002CA5D963|nr:alpha/beta fold hydrolase [Baekduia sp.]HMJ32929.1 alpha/beta fold hydrolase [Baekduia sp.]